MPPSVDLSNANSRLQAAYNRCSTPPLRHRQLQPLVSPVSPPGSTYGYGETTEGQEGKEKLVTASVQACAKYINRITSSYFEDINVSYFCLSLVLFILSL